MPQTPIRILLADDHQFFRDGLRAFIVAQPDLELVGEAATGDDVVAKAQMLRPDVILMDLRMPGLNGIEATRQIVRTQPEARILVLTMVEETEAVLAAMRAGARGYILKDADHEDLLLSIRAVAKGEALFGRAVAGRLLSLLANWSPHDPRALFPQLSEREREILSLMARDFSNQAIADQLGLSLKTARNHVSSILAKLQAADRVEAAERARSAGLGRNGDHVVL